MPTLIGLLLALSCALAGQAQAADDAACAGEPPGRQFVHITSGAQIRNVLVFIPAAANVRHALPLLIDLHGSRSNGMQQAALSGFTEISSRESFIVANPDGGVPVPGVPDGHRWNIPGVPLSGNTPVPRDAPDDVQFLSDLIDQMIAHHCVDGRRVYVTGMSGGARMTSFLACQFANRIAAIAPVSGLRAGTPQPSGDAPDPASCQPQRAMPIVTFHGTADAVNPYAGGGDDYWRYSVSAALQRWQELDHCAPAPEVRAVAAHVRSIRYTHCDGGAELLLYLTDAPGELGGGHSWPGSRNTGAADNHPSREITASELIWQFVSHFSLPAATPSPAQ